MSEASLDTGIAELIQRGNQADTGGGCIQPTQPFANELYTSRLLGPNGWIMLPDAGSCFLFLEQFHPFGDRYSQYTQFRMESSAAFFDGCQQFSKCFRKRRHTFLL